MIHWVPSAGDPRLEPYRHVADPAWLYRHGLFVAEGRLVLSRLIPLDRFTITSVLVNQAAHDALLQPLSSLEANVYVCDDDILSAITGFNFHRGCLALATRPAPDAVDRFYDGRRLLALEGVGNPDNVGGLFRTAAAFGVDGILMNRTTGDPFYRKALRTSMGAALRMPFARLDEWLPGLEAFRQRGFRVIALTPANDAEPLEQFAGASHQSSHTVLVVGSEGSGLGRETLVQADARVRIPIDPAVDSLNVVVAAAIALDRLRH